MTRKILTAFLATLLILSMACTALAAAGDPNAPDHPDCSLTVTLRDNGSPISGAPVYIWKIADVTGSDANLHYTPAEKFKEPFENYLNAHLEELNKTNWERSSNGWDWSSWDRFAETFIRSDSRLIRIIIDEKPMSTIYQDSGTLILDESVPETYETVGTGQFDENLKQLGAAAICGGSF